mgnify:CR=1 FL=1
MLWENEVAKRGIVWAAIWDNQHLRQITSSLRVVVWQILQPHICMIHTATIPTQNSECDFSDLIRRQATPPRIPSVRHPSILTYVAGILTGWKN